MCRATPSHSGGSAYWYYVRTVEGSEYPIYCRVAATDRRTPPDPERDIDGEEVLLDGNLEAAGHEFFSIGAFNLSLNGRLLAYSVDVTGAERFTLMIKDLATGELLAGPDRRHRVRSGLGRRQPPLLHPGRRGLAALRRAPAPARRRSRCGRGGADRGPDERFWVGVDGEP